MRALFVILVIANVLLAIYAGLSQRRPDSGRPSGLEINRDKIRIVPAPPAPPVPLPGSPASGGLPPAAGERPPSGEDKVSGGAKGCFEWGTLAPSNVARAEQILAALGLGQQAEPRDVTEATGWWVYVPPLESREQVRARIAELRGKGIRDLSPMPDGSKWRNAISLGVFRAEDAARAHLARLEAQGVTGAVAGPRDTVLRGRTYRLRTDADASAKLEDLRREFPATAITPCPAP